MDNKDDFLLDNDEDFLPLTPSSDESVVIENDVIPEQNIVEQPNVLPIDQIVSEQNILQVDQMINESNNMEQPNILPIDQIMPEQIIDNQNIIQENNIIYPSSIEQSITTEDNQPTKLNVKERVYKYAKILPVLAFTFVTVLGVYIFVHNVHADIINLIKVEENSKVGYINNEGNVVIKPKYLYGTDYYKGYAIVKNYNNLFGIINGKGDNEISFGNIFSANLYSNRYIVSKFTNDGLKMGLLDSNLNELTRYKYDNLSYSKSGIFMYTYDDTMGILNSDGKEIFTYKVDEVDDKNISVEVSNLTNKQDSQYAKVKINSSSTIINISTGKEVYKYTLDDIRVLDNNVFYIKNKNSNNKYFIIKDDKIVYQTDDYKRIRVEDPLSDIAIAIKEDASIDYINLLNKEIINTDENVKYTYSDGVILQEMYNFQTNKNEFTVITPKKILGTFSDIDLVDNEYVNGYMKIKTQNDKYNFVNKNGNILSDKEYEEISDFNENGFAIVSNDNSYGLINTSGKEILEIKYDGIEFLDDTLFKNINKKTNEQLFIIKDNNKYGIINSNGKIMIKPIYDSFKVITTKYPILKAKYNGENTLLNLESYKNISIDSKDDVQVYEDYILSNNNYYNYNGDLIYTVGGDL